MPDLPPEQPGAPGQPPGPRKRSAKQELMRIAAQKKRRDVEERKRNLVRFAKTDIEKEVAQAAMDSGYDDPWGWIDDLAVHGCESGMVSGLIYYNETSKFYEAHKEEIWEMLAEDAESTGENILVMLSQMRWAGNISDESTFANYLAWYAYETAAQRLLDRHESGEEPDEESQDEGPINIGLG